MDFVRKILEIFENSLQNDDTGFCTFPHVSAEDSEHYIITIYPEINGYLIFAVVPKDQWLMIIDICQLTSSNVQDMISYLVDNDEITSLVIDPRNLE